ncbi:MAG: BrnT family toxin [Spirochaetales bacterium]|nr:BrnT family toxin [Spirochaetales bacterium]
MKLPDSSKIVGCDWNKGNAEKVSNRHSVHPAECEEVFFHDPILVIPDEMHSESEDRFHVLGRTATYRLLFLVFTIRRNKIRIISTRNMTRREQKAYESHLEEDSEI